MVIESIKQHVDVGFSVHDVEQLYYNKVKPIQDILSKNGDNNNANT